MNTADQSIAAQEKIRKDFRWNFIVNMLDGTSFWFGVSFMSAAVILPLYVSHFTDNPILTGLIPFFGTAGYLVPQLFAANVVERAPVKKFFPVTLVFFLQPPANLSPGPGGIFPGRQPTHLGTAGFLPFVRLAHHRDRLADCRLSGHDRQDHSGR